MTSARTDLRSGYTTGACAAAAGKAALSALLEQTRIDKVSIRLPAGQAVEFTLHSCTHTAHDARASVIKDAGDDPDVTDKAEIIVHIAWSNSPGIHFERGEGVGLVTKKGLPVPPGEPAINPAPRQLITQTLNEVLDDYSPIAPVLGGEGPGVRGLKTTRGESPPSPPAPLPPKGGEGSKACEHGLAGRGLVVTISVPGGAEIARKTFNPRLGIVDGISILGTTGIVVPYSTTAWLASVTQEIDVARAQWLTHLVLSVGERGERLARRIVPEPVEAFIQIGPFFGDALKHCAKAGVQRITLVSMIGKLAKFAAGNESVHSTASRQDFAFLAGLAREAGASEEVVISIAQANTAQETAELMAGKQRFFEMICERARTFGQSMFPVGPIAVVLIDGQGGVLARV